MKIRPANREFLAFRNRLGKCSRQFFFSQSTVQQMSGKAVKIGHSCAAVTSHDPTSRSSDPEQSQSSLAKVKARGKAPVSSPGTHSESEYLPAAPHAPGDSCESQGVQLHRKNEA
jgi:hypothetical protein